MSINNIRLNMTSLNEECSLISSANDTMAERPRSFLWQIFQATNYMIDSLCFTAGSCMYFTGISQPYPSTLTIGGWLFTIGSLIFLSADLQDWWNHRTGYCFSYKHFPSVDVALSLPDSSTSSDQVDHKETEIELNVYGSICGAAFYLAGSILFIPVFEPYLPVGEWFFIMGSTFCYVSLIWKLYRSACNTLDRKFHLRTLLNDKPTLAMDVLSMLGNIFFFVGTILFLSYINTNNFDENRATVFFVLGSLCFLLSSFVLQYTICYSHCR